MQLLGKYPLSKSNTNVILSFLFHFLGNYSNIWPTTLNFYTQVFNPLGLHLWHLSCASLGLNQGLMVLLTVIWLKPYFLSSLCFSIWAPAWVTFTLIANCSVSKSIPNHWTWSCSTGSLLAPWGRPISLCSWSPPAGPCPSASPAS